MVHDARVNAPHVARGRFCPGLKYAVQVSLVAIEHSPLRHAVTTTPSGALPLVFLRVCDLSAPCCRHLTTRGTRREERVATVVHDASPCFRRRTARGTRREERVGQREERVAQTITGLSNSLLAMCTQASKTPAKVRQPSGAHPSRRHPPARPLTPAWYSPPPSRTFNPFLFLQMAKFREECVIRENKKARTLTAADRLAQRHLSDLSAFEGG